MSTTTNNIKISQLSELDTIDNGAKLKIPLSKQKSYASTNNWRSYGVSADVLSKFMDGSLGLSDVGSEKGLRSQVTDLQAQITQFTGQCAELEKKLGKYDLASNIALEEVEHNKYISTSGETIESEGYSISNKVRLKQGNLYLFNVDSTEDFPADISLMTKVYENEYRTPSGTTGIDTVYEPLSTNYYLSNGGNGAPSSGYLVFFATENMDVVISSSTTSFNDGLSEVKYGVFAEMSNNLLTINGDFMQIIVEAIANNKKDIDSLRERKKSFGNIRVASIDCDDFPSVQGEPMIVVADRDPSGEANNHGADVPNRIGQIWVNKTTGVAYIAISLGGIDGWKQITNP